MFVPQLLICLSLSALLSSNRGIVDASFAATNGTLFVIDGRPFYPNGFNAYWLMTMASDPAEKDKVSSALQQASVLGLNLVRSWAFSDGGYRPLQHSPGLYNEDMFKGLDFVIAEANKYGINLILSLVNNFDDYGGRRQYVEWARDQGGQHHLNSDDDFYTNNVVKGYYKSHVERVLTRINTITGEMYKNDPTIFAWELMNEPRCDSDLSSTTLQDWITEMASYVKSIDSNHLLEVGMEGFYGESTPRRKQFNPGYGVGTDFISNNRVPDIDFATIHAYPDQWRLRVRASWMPPLEELSGELVMGAAHVRFKCGCIAPSWSRVQEGTLLPSQMDKVTHERLQESSEEATTDSRVRQVVDAAGCRLHGGPEGCTVHDGLRLHLRVVHGWGSLRRRTILADAAGDGSRRVE